MGPTATTAQNIQAEWLFYACMALATASWIALALAPKKRAVNWWLCGVITPVILGIIYIYLMIADWDGMKGASFLRTYTWRFDSLPHIQSMFKDQGLLLVAWLDILTMDLVAGAWMARRAIRTQMPYPLLLLALIATYTNAPVGLLVYYAIDAVRGKMPVPPE